MRKTEPRLNQDDLAVTYLDKRELATTLAALRHWQNQGLAHKAWGSLDGLHDIASDGGTLVPLSDKEIDNLCEKINQ